MNALIAADDIFNILKDKHAALFLDYDGTLTPIVDTPDLAVLPEAMRRTLQRLAALIPVAVISGRDLEEVRRLVGVEGICYAGSHGMDIDGLEENPKIAEQAAALDAAELLLKEGVRAIAGSLVERKRYGVAVHYRMVMPNQWPLVEQVVEMVHGQHPGLRKARGKMVIELVPDVKWNKGIALRWLQQEIGASGPALFIGDDITDEDVFNMLSSNEIGIVVMAEPRPTAARYFLKDPEEVGEFLEKLADSLCDKPT